MGRKRIHSRKRKKALNSGSGAAEGQSSLKRGQKGREDPAMKPETGVLKEPLWLCFCEQHNRRQGESREAVRRPLPKSRWGAAGAEEQ